MVTIWPEKTREGLLTKEELKSVIAV